MRGRREIQVRICRRKTGQCVLPCRFQRYIFLLTEITTEFFEGLAFRRTFRKFATLGVVIGPDTCSKSCRDAWTRCFRVIGIVVRLLRVFSVPRLFQVRPLPRLLIHMDIPFHGIGPSAALPSSFRLIVHHIGRPISSLPVIGQSGVTVFRLGLIIPPSPNDIRLGLHPRTSLDARFSRIPGILPRRRLRHPRAGRRRDLIPPRRWSRRRLLAGTHTRQAILSRSFRWFSGGRRSGVRSAPESAGIATAFDGRVGVG
mmetsp:Transcript_467/g.848  ORF Transcript_467/g.848 Transcript_467/m.848 type:complete len:257 (-) Transcript_467:1379-2149(-)